MHRSLRVCLRGGWITVLLLILSVGGTLAQGNGNLPKFINGEAIITVPRGTARATVDAIASSVNANVVYSFGALDFERTVDGYHLRSKANLNPSQTEQIVANLKKDARVRNAWPNLLRRKMQSGQTAIPNDPRFNEQWDKVMMRMPEAWTIEKGQNTAVIAVIDTGLDLSHPEFPANRIYKPYNSELQTTDPNPPAGDIHGTHVTGIAAAQTNNAIGVAGVAWDNVLIMPIRAGGDSGFSLAALARAYQYVIDQKNAAPTKKFVINASLGAQAPSDLPDPGNLLPDTLVLYNALKQGIVACLAAGNDFESGNPPADPAYLAAISPNAICVTSVAHTGQKAYYSQARSYSTIAAPGGDVRAGRQILSTFPVVDGSYSEIQGTSMACPQVAGVAALLLSVPGVNPGDVKAVLQQTAKRVSGAQVPSPEYGYGIVDAYAALLKVAIGVNVVTPDGTGGNNAGKPGTPLPIETLRPLIRIHVSQIMTSNLTIKIDNTVIPECTSAGDPGPCYRVENVSATTADENGNQVPSTFDAVIDNMELSPGAHIIEVVGVKPSTPNDITVTDTRRFVITPHLIPAGRAMISIPYYQPDGGSPGTPLTPETYFGSDFRLARWVPEEGRYAFYSSFGVRDPHASLTPPDVIPHLDGESTPRWPLGIGYWSDTESAKPVLTRGQALTDRAIVIPLKGNGSGNDRFITWHMIGDPFPFDVPFNSLMVDTPSGRISITEAVTMGLLLPNIFSYDNVAGYTYRTLPDGALRAWQSHWIGVTSRDNISLVVPPTSAPTRSASIGAPAPGTAGGWTLQLSAHTKNLKDTFNFIGVSTRATDGYGREDTPKPPMASPYLSLGVSHADWGRQSGLYASDVRSAGGTKTWTVNVDSDQANADVTVTWSGRTLPRDYKLTIKDETSGQVVDMRTRSSITFSTGASAAGRKFTVTAKPSLGTLLRITNVAVRGNRGSGGSNIGFTMTSDATYDVKVLSAAGSPVSSLATRASGAGNVNVYWNGKDAGGRSVASGNYLVQIRATTTDGESVKVIHPFAVVR